MLRQLKKGHHHSQEHCYQEDNGHSRSDHSPSLRQTDESPYEYTQNANRKLNSGPTTIKSSKRRSKSVMKSYAESESRSRSSGQRSRSRQQQQQQHCQVSRQRQQREHGSTPRTRGYSPAPRQSGTTNNPYVYNYDHSNSNKKHDTMIQELSTSYDQQLSLGVRTKNSNYNSASSDGSYPTNRKISKKIIKQIREQSQLPLHYQPRQHQSFTAPLNDIKSQTLATKSAINEDEYNMQIMKEREAEILAINQKMHTVNEIYKDLAIAVEGQQELIDKIDDQIQLANGYTKQGNENYLEARLRAENPIFDDPFGDKLSAQNDPYQFSNSDRGRIRRTKNHHDKRKKRSKSRHKDKYHHSLYGSHMSTGVDCSSPIEAMPAEVQVVLKTGLQDIKELGNKIMKACTAPQFDEVNEYAYKSHSSLNPSIYDRYT